MKDSSDILKDLSKKVELLNDRIDQTIEALPSGNRKFELGLLWAEHKTKTCKLLKEVQKCLKKKQQIAE
jgi:hypothetical protein